MDPLNRGVDVDQPKTCEIAVLPVNAAVVRLHLATANEARPSATSVCHFIGVDCTVDVDDDLFRRLTM